MLKISACLTIAMLGISMLWNANAYAGQVSPSEKLVWSHAMIVFPLDLDVVKPWLPQGYETVYVAYPLDVRRNYPRGFYQLADVKSGQAAGLDGFSVDIFANGNAADGYMTAADQVSGFNIAPCLDGVNEETAVKAVAAYCDSAKTHLSAAKVGDAFVIFTYGTGGSEMTPEAWRRVREALVARGYKTYWVSDLGAGDYRGGYFNASRITSFFPIFEAGYVWDPKGARLNDLAALYRANDKPFAGGIMPGYFRLGGGDMDAKGTQTYRDEWKLHLAAQPNWAHISTWNDLAETTEIMPNSDFNVTRSDLTYWFAAKFRNQPISWQQPHLYITTPKTVYPSQNYIVEGLVLNALTKPVQVSVQLLDSERKPFGEPVTATVEPASDGAAVVPLKLDSFPPGHFLRAIATLRDGTEILSSVLSAPIAVLDPEAQPGFTTLYYSIPADKSLSGEVKVTLDGQPTDGKTARVNIVAPPGTHTQFSEVLFNNQILKNFLNEVPMPLDVPFRRLATIKSSGTVALPAGAIVGGTEWGFYMARVTDAQYRVGYSDPIYIAPSGDLTLKEKYSFDEGVGQVTNDTSTFKRVAVLQNVEWIGPGFESEGSALSFNGKDSRLNLMLNQTPSGPLLIKMVVRPRTYGGDFFCDSGGMWMTTNKQGHVLFVRLGPGGLVVAISKTILPLGQWTPLEFHWNGNKLQIFVNGEFDGQALCGAKFASQRRALGYNPFGSGSGYYNGDLDDFEIKSLLLPSPFATNK